MITPQDDRGWVMQPGWFWGIMVNQLKLDAIYNKFSFVKEIEIIIVAYNNHSLIFIKFQNFVLN